MDTAISLKLLLEAIATIAAIWGFVKLIKEVLVAVNEKHDRAQKWDEAFTRSSELENKMIEAYKADQEQKWKEYDKRITDIQTQINDKHCDTDAKIQEMRSELCLLTYAMMGALDGLKQLGCNGKVSEAREKIDKHLNQQAHGKDAE